jgi:hypothetical protein
MRPKIAMWSDYRSPTRKHWKSPYRRSTRPSIGLKILLAPIVLVAGIVGVSGIYPQIIDSEWVRNAGPHAKRPAVAEATTKRAVGPIAAVPLSPRGAAMTTGDAAASAPPRAAPPTPPTLRTPAAAEPPKAPSAVAAAVDVPPGETAPPPADVPDAQAAVDPPVQPAVAASPVVRPAQRYVARAPVVKRRVARTEHRRSNSSAYAQYGGWGGGGWGGWSSFGSPYHF